MAREPASIEYPVLSHARAQPSEDGFALLVDGVTVDQQIVRFALALPDIRNLIGFLLASLGRMGHQNPEAAALLAARGEPLEPVPISSFAVADGEDGAEALVVVGIGPTELTFSLPAAAFDPIGRAMLTASAKPSAAGPS